MIYEYTARVNIVCIVTSLLSHAMFLAIKSAVTGWFSKPEPENVIFGATLDKQLATVPPVLLTLQQYILRHGNINSI